ncbi:MAG: right-handed parallel beta-helix repeat-containing protein [Planctomycetota bacterium]
MQITIAASLALLSSPALAQTTWFVDAAAAPTGDGSAAAPFATIQSALAAPTTVSGDTVHVAPGVYSESIDLLGKDIVLEARDPSLPLPVIGVPGSGPAVRIHSGETAACLLRNLVVADAAVSAAAATGEAGGGIRIANASPTLASITVRGCSARLGGGLSVDGGTPRAVDCTFDANGAFEGGGAYVSAGTLRLEDCVFTDHRDALFGSALAVVASGAVDADGCTFVDNRVSAGGAGGAVMMRGSASVFVVTDSLFEANGGGFDSGVFGGAIFGSDGVEATGCTFDGNGLGEGAAAGGAAVGGRYSDCLFTDNAAQRGGALEGAIAVGCVFEDNLACGEGSGSGGAAWDCTLERCVLRGNRACSSGGGAARSDHTSCLVEGNGVLNTCEGGLEGAGGGLALGTATDSIVRGNVVHPNDSCSGPGSGGGTSGTSLVRCVVTFNRAPEFGGVRGGAHDFVTAAANEAALFSGGSGTFTNSIVWSNFGGVDLDPSSTVSFSNTAGGVQPGPGNLSVDPLFLSAAAVDVGLRSGSPSIDAADPSAPLDPDGSRADMGARPFDPSATYTFGVFCDRGGPDVGLLGDPSLTPVAPTRFVATGLPAGQFGLLVVGSGVDRTPIPTNATLCVGGALIRMPVQTISSVGIAEQDVDAATIAGTGATVGDLVHMQFWYRSGPGSAALSPAVEALVRP